MHGGYCSVFACQGVLRLNVVAGRELKAADIKIIGKGKSDPYCCVYGECVYSEK